MATRKPLVTIARSAREIRSRPLIQLSNKTTRPNNIVPRSFFHPIAPIYVSSCSYASPRRLFFHFVSVFFLWYPSLTVFFVDFFVFCFLLLSYQWEMGTVNRNFFRFVLCKIAHTKLLVGELKGQRHSVSWFWADVYSAVGVLNYFLYSFVRNWSMQATTVDSVYRLVESWWIKLW